MRLTKLITLIIGTTLSIISLFFPVFDKFIFGYWGLYPILFLVVGYGFKHITKEYAWIATCVFSPFMISLIIVLLINQKADNLPLMDWFLRFAPFALTISAVILEHFIYKFYIPIRIVKSVEKDENDCEPNKSGLKEAKDEITLTKNNVGESNRIEGQKNEILKTQKAQIKNKHRKLTIICIVIAILVAVLGVFGIIQYNKWRYMRSCPSDGFMYLKISAVSKRTDGQGSLGNELTYNYYMNGNQFKNGDIRKVIYNTDIHLKTMIVEHDSIDDIGEANLYVDIKDYTTAPVYLYDTVLVKETGGKKNKGAWEEFQVKYTLKRVLPNDKGIFYFLFYK